MWLCGTSWRVQESVGVWHWGFVHDPSPPSSGQVSFKGNGPLGTVMAISDARGHVKGRVDNPSADPPLREDGKLNVGAAVGLGGWGAGSARCLGSC